MTNEVQKQYDRLEDVLSIMLCMKDVYAVPNWHIRYAATKAFFGTKMAEGSSVQSHGVKMLSLVEKLEDLKAGLDNDTYIDVILQSLPPSYDPFIINYNMNGLEKSIHELINMLVQYEAMTHKFEPAVLVGEASTSKAKGKGARCWKRKKGKGMAVTTTASTEGAPPAARKGKSKGKVRGSQQSRANDVCIHCHGKGHWKRECPQLLSHPGMFVVEINIIFNSASWVLDTGCGAHICNNLRVLQRSRKLSKDEMILRLGDGKAIAAEAVGSLSLVVSNHVRIDLKDYYFVSSMVKNIISIPILDSDGYTFLIDKNYFYLVHEDVYHILGTLVNDLYILQQSNLIMTAQHKRKVDNHENAQIWHARLGHISKDRIRRLVDSKSLDIDDLDHLPTCESCLKEKMTKKPFVGQSAIANGLFDLVHTDVCGPLSVPARGGFSYFITFTDDHSRLWLCLPDETPPGTPQLNGVAERRNRTLLGMVRSMMSFLELPPSFWGHALETAVKLFNIAPSKSVPQTPYEIWHGKPASYKYLRVWGSPAYVKSLVGDKLDSSISASSCQQASSRPASSHHASSWPASWLARDLASSHHVSSWPASWLARDLRASELASCT
ncbi:UNVERIFIED_CONTAM: hypothetical protein Slati_2414000 [Sesamum latifolium]|uniref:Uncharacterized protein n=1 Tax=Sesamum latifolium TaxID=2727402 RepID=A0AAW2WDE2_9LAMI